MVMRVLKCGENIRRVAPSWVTPRFTDGDVLMLMDPDTWRNGKMRGQYRALLYAALVAMVACARVRPRTALHLRLADYRRDALVPRNLGGYPYPAVILPVVKAAIDAYLDERERLGIGGGNLFVGEQGQALGYTSIASMLNRVLRRYGHYGGGLVERLVEFFDAQLLGENRDVPAAIALRRGRDPVRDLLWSIEAVRDAAADRDRLREVLERNHAFAGNPGRWRGGHGKAKATKTARLFLHECLNIPKLPILRTDPVCARLLTYDWLTGHRHRRAHIVRLDLPHLVDLLDEGKIRAVHIAYLLCVRPRRAAQLVKSHRAARETPAAKRQRQTLESHWRERALDLYGSRPRTESTRAFFGRIKSEEGYPFSWGSLVGLLLQRDLLPRQVRRRSKKGMSALLEKSKSSTLLSGKNDRMGRHAGVSEGLKGHQKGLIVLKTPRKGSGRISYKDSM
jgi:hypothetical protein